MNYGREKKYFLFAQKLSRNIKLECGLPLPLIFLSLSSFSQNMSLVVVGMDYCGAETEALTHGNWS